MTIVNEGKLDPILVLHSSSPIDTELLKKYKAVLLGSKKSETNPSINANWLKFSDFYMLDQFKNNFENNAKVL